MFLFEKINFLDKINYFYWEKLIVLKKINIGKNYFPSLF